MTAPATTTCDRCGATTTASTVRAGCTAAGATAPAIGAHFWIEPGVAGRVYLETATKAELADIATERAVDTYLDQQAEAEANEIARAEADDYRDLGALPW
jgi:hypothetical protein